MHDTASQHLRALKAMNYEPCGSFITSVLELKLDANTTFEWQKHSQDSEKVPHFTALLEFINLRARASESTSSDPYKKRSSEFSALKRTSSPRSVTSFAATIDDGCVVCKAGKHQLYACQKFKLLSHDQKIAVLRGGGICMNCFRSGHFVKQCPSLQRCRRCQKPHHTLLHLEVSSRGPEPTASASPSVPPLSSDSQSTTILSHVAQTGSECQQTLLMTCQVLIVTPSGLTTRARCLLDSASSTSFVSEHLVQRLCLPCHRKIAQIAGVGRVAHRSLKQYVVRFSVTSAWSTGRVIPVEAVILGKVTCDLPLHPVTMESNWCHLSGIRLADPDFRSPGRIDVLLGVDVFCSALLQGRRFGPPGSPSVFETSFGWVIAGGVHSGRPSTRLVSHHASVLTGDDLLRKFWEVEELNTTRPVLSSEEQSVVTHFHRMHHHDEHGRFVVPLSGILKQSHWENQDP